MADSNSIINLGDWSKPANTLVEKISDAIGGIARPWQIKRVAEAEAQATKIQAVAQIEITAQERRAMRRMLMEEAKKQNNIEGIIAKALPDVGEQAKPEQVEDDWITNFFDKCRLISDEDMQKLWAKVLAGEANSSGKFSKRTVDLLASLDKSDALLLMKLCSLAVRVLEREGELFPLIYSLSNPIYAELGINFATLAHLQSINLIHFDINSDRGYQLDVRFSDNKGVLYYFDQKLFLEFPPSAKSLLHAGKVFLTKSGQELASICSPQPAAGFVGYVREVWRSFGYKTDPAEEFPTAYFTVG